MKGEPAGRRGCFDLVGQAGGRSTRAGGTDTGPGIGGPGYGRNRGPAGVPRPPGIFSCTGSLSRNRLPLTPQKRASAQPLAPALLCLEIETTGDIQPSPESTGRQTAGPGAGIPAGAAGPAQDRTGPTGPRALGRLPPLLAKDASWVRAFALFRHDALKTMNSRVGQPFIQTISIPA